MIWQTLGAGAFTGFLFLVFSFPLLFRFCESVFAMPDWSFDTYGTLYGIWWLKYAFQHGLNADLNPLLAHPFGLDWSHLPSQPLVTWPLLGFALLDNEIFAFNLFAVLNYALTGAFTYAFFYYATGHPRGSLLGTLIFTFAPNHMLQTMAHLSFSATQWIPLFALSLLVLWEKRNWMAVLFCAFSFCFLFWSNYYFFYFSLFWVAIFGLMAVLFRRKFPLKNFGKCAAGAALCAGLLLAPQLVGIAKHVQYPKSTPEVEASGYRRSEQDLTKYAARFTDYTMPSEHHPIFGRITQWIQKKWGGRHWSDRTLYLGAFALTIVPWLFGYRRRLSPRDRFVICGAVAGILFFFWLSLPPWYHIGPVSIPTPSLFLYPLFPMFRYYCRAGFFVCLFMSLCSAYVWKYFPRQFPEARTKNLVCALFAFLILFEFTVVPPARNLDLSTAPAEYLWLKEQSGDFAVVEYPFVRAIEERQQRYAFYQRIHGKKLVNGGDEGTLADALRKYAQHVEDPAMWALLKHFGTRYALVHEKPERFENNPSLKPAAQFGATKIYEITAPSQSLYTLLWNFGQAEKGPDGRDDWRWIGRTAKQWCYNPSPQSVRAKLKLTLFSPAENQLKLILNDQEVFAILVKGGEAAATTIEIPNLVLKNGENLIQFVPQRLLPHPEEKSRRVSFCLGQPQLVLEER